MKELVVHALLKCFVILTYVVSHLWDYVSYPVYFLYYRAWRVRRYKRSNHARREDRDDCIIYHSTQDPGAKNVEIEKNDLDTMHKIFEHVSLEKQIPI